MTAVGPEGQEVQTCESFDLGTDGIKDISEAVVDAHVIEGARDDSEQSDTKFQGKLQNLSISARSPAQYHLIFILIMAGSALLCTLRLVGSVWLEINNITRKAAGDRHVEPDEQSRIDAKKETSFLQRARVNPGREQHLKDWKAGVEKAKEQQDKENNRCVGSHLWMPRWAWITFLYLLQQTATLWALMVITCPRGAITPSQNDKDWWTIFCSTLSFSAAPWGWLFAGNAVIETLLFVGPCLLQAEAWPERGGSDVDVGLGKRTGYVKSEGERPMRACLLIACHQSVINQEERSGFEGTLRAALDTFDPENIFVCDNARQA